MPIYEYHCETCGEEFELLQKFHEEAPRHHHCAPDSVVHKKVSLNAFQLRGGGWYQQGYEHAKPKPPEGGAAPDAAAGPGGGEPKKKAPGGEGQSGTGAAKAGEGKAPAGNTAPPKGPAPSSTPTSASQA